MAISFIGSVYAESTGVTPPTHQAGDLFVCFAYRDGSATAPSLPAGWTNSNSAGANTNSFRMGYKIAASSSDTCTGWTNASGVILHVYRGAAFVGASNQQSASNATLTYPAVTLQNTSGTSWVVGFAGHRSTNTTTIANAPTGMTNRGSLLGVNSDYASHDTNGGVSSWISRTVATGGTASGYYTAVAEILPAEPATLSSPIVSISSVTSGTPIVTTNFNAGTIYMVAVPDGDTPSVAQIKAGQRSNGTAAIASQNQTVTAVGVQTFTTVSGLTTNTDYDFWFVHTNAYGDSTAVKADFKPMVRTDTGWMNAGVISSEGGSVLFSNPANAVVEDGVYATVTLGAANAAQLLARNFNPNIPEGATIKGMEIRVKALASGSNTQIIGALSFDASSNAAVTTSPTANNYVQGVLTTTNTMYSAGASTGWSSNYWGGFVDPNTGDPVADPTITQINSSNFGVYVQTINFAGTASNVSVDTIQLKIYFDENYTPPAPSNPPPVLFWAFP